MRTQSRGEQAAEEVGGLHGPLSTGAANPEVRPECQHHRGELASRIGVREVPADRSPIADLRMGHERDGLEEKR